MFRSYSFYCQINTDIQISHINCLLSDLLFPLQCLLTLQFLAVRGSYEHSPPYLQGCCVCTVVYVLYCMVHIRKYIACLHIVVYSVYILFSACTLYLCVYCGQLCVHTVQFMYVSPMPICPSEWTCLSTH